MEGTEMTKVKTSYGQEIDFEAAVNLMDECVMDVASNCYKENDHYAEAGSDVQAFYNEYCIQHFEFFGEEFEPDKINGQW